MPALLKPASDAIVELDVETPLLLVVVDTEEEFDWSGPFDSRNVSVGATDAQHLAHRIFDRFGVIPTYVIDYPVATQEDGLKPLKELFDAGHCAIGAHLHPWVNPPIVESVSSSVNSYPGNLPAALERDKLAQLTDAIEAGFGARPTIYKAGRYGVGPNTAETLSALGYCIDMSVLPWTDTRAVDGPDFRACSAKPYWFGVNRDLLEIPLSVGYSGALRASGPALYPQVTNSTGTAMHLPGVLARLGILERITLTPEGINHAEHKRLTRALLADNHRVFSLTYHSPSLAPGHTPYVRNEADLREFLDRIERFLDFFMGDIGGEPSTPYHVHRLCQNKSA